MYEAYIHTRKLVKLHCDKIYCNTMHEIVCDAIHRPHGTRGSASEKQCQMGKKDCASCKLEFGASFLPRQKATLGTGSCQPKAPSVL